MKHLWAVPVLLFFISTTARADSTWTYTGNASSGSQAINNTGGNGFAIDGTVTFAGTTETSASLLSFTFTQGPYTFNNTDSTLVIHPDSFGIGPPWSPSGWEVLSDSGQILLSVITYDVGESTDSGPAGSEEGNPGTWTETSAVATPESGTLALLGAGLVGLFARKRSKAQVAQSIGH
jgi:hypothetical protein